LTKTIVLKFGGASVKSPAHFKNIVDIISKKRELFSRVVVVVSAMGNTTDRLLKLAHQVSSSPPKRELDMLLSVGERVSIALLAMALSNQSIEAKSFTGSQSGIITTTDHSNAKIVDVRPKRLESCLSEGQIAIVAGFQGVSHLGEITTLGRGGSDTSAVALALALDAEIEFFKDVLGVFDSDPKQFKEAKLYTQLTYDAALKIEGKILSKRCLELAKKNALPLKVVSFIDLNSQGSLVKDPLLEKPFQPLYEEHI
jgi:aspartate kinase